MLPSQLVTSSVVIYTFALDVLLDYCSSASYLIKFYARKLTVFFFISVFIGRFTINARAHTPTCQIQISVGQKTPQRNRFTCTSIISYIIYIFSFIKCFTTIPRMRLTEYVFAYLNGTYNN